MAIDQLTEKIRIQLRVNGRDEVIQVSTQDTLLNVLRDQLGLTGAKPGCEKGDCGACTVLLDGKPVNSCLVLAASADGREVITIEGIGTPENPHPIQLALAKEGVMQCGYCAPGMVTVLYAFLKENPNPSRDEILNAISGNICRCGAYGDIADAILTLGSSIEEAK